MVAKKVKSVALKYNAKGELVEVLEIKTLTESEINELKAKASENKAKIELEQQAKLKNEERRLARLQIALYIVAKSQFNELVESGKTDTTKEFEEMYDNFINGASFVEEIAPLKYREILGRLVR